MIANIDIPQYHHYLILIHHILSITNDSIASSDTGVPDNDWQAVQHYSFFSSFSWFTHPYPLWLSVSIIYRSPENYPLHSHHSLHSPQTVSQPQDAVPSPTTPFDHQLPASLPLRPVCSRWGISTLCFCCYSLSKRSNTPLPPTSATNYLERPMAADIVYNDNCIGTSVVGSRERPELLLPCLIQLLPAVSQMANRTSSCSITIFLNMKSTPMVMSWLSLKSPSMNLLKIEDLPTEDSPTRTNLN